MIYMFFSEGFEEVEALAVIDVLRRASLKVSMVGLTSDFVTSSHGITVKMDARFDETFDYTKAQMLILPGGQPGTDHLMASEALGYVLKKSFENGCYIAAICAAPTVLEHVGITSGKRLTCYPTYAQRIEKGIVIDEDVVVDGKLITGRGVGVALDFGLKLVEILVDETKSRTLRAAMVMRA